MTERTFLQWLKKAGKKWKPFLMTGGMIRLSVSDCNLCPLEAVQALKQRLAPEDANYLDAQEDLDIGFEVVDQADDVLDRANAQLRPKMLKALGLKEAK